MWYDNIKEGYTWSSLWYDYVICGNCSGIRTFDRCCGGCGQQLSPPKTYQSQHGIVIPEVGEGYVGGEGRYEDYVYLNMIEREWVREISDADRFLDVFKDKRPSPRAVIILIFWTYFETRINRLMKNSMYNLPARVSADLLKKNNTISDRLNRLYKILFDTNYFDDLTESGYGSIAAMLKKLQEKRNAFMHGAPEAIDDSTIEELIGNLKLEHESWIAVYNKRATQK